jgi:hypothetical protein
MLRVAAAVLLLVDACSTAIQCPVPQPFANFSHAAFAGKWREIGKYQTYNPFESGCNCTSIQVDPSLPKISDTCLKNGAVSNITADLNPVGTTPGVFDEVFHFGPVASSTRLTIVDMGVVPGDSRDETYAVEFDCSVQLYLSRSYCFHVFTRSGNAPQALLDRVQRLAASLGLNPENLAWQPTYQGAGCP